MTHHRKPHQKSQESRRALVQQLETDLAEICEDEFRLAIPHSAADFAKRLSDRLRERWGCEARYIPASDHGKRDRSIRSTYNGRNLLEVCSKFEVSPSTVYRICGRPAAAFRDLR